jgi:integrase
MPAATETPDVIRPACVAGREKVFGLSESQIARRVKAIAKAAGLADWEFFSGHSGRVGMARRMAQNGAPTHEIERQGRWKQGGGMVGRYTRGETAGSALRYL